MGYREAKAKVLSCLVNGHVLHEERGNIDIKNQLAIGLVSLKEAEKIIGRSAGIDYICSAHHFDSYIDVHVIKTWYSGRRWYIKWYFLDTDSVFISFHN